jgi:phosphoribosylformylglycinamidine synthase
MNEVQRVYVEKLNDFKIQAENLQEEMDSVLGISSENVRLINVYDIENLFFNEFEMAAEEVLSEPNVDKFFFDFKLEEGEKAFRVEYLPGQYDQRADSAMQCVRLLDSKLEPKIRASVIYVFQGISDEELIKLKGYLINPVDSREVSLEMPKTLTTDTVVPEPVKQIEDFISMDENALNNLLKGMGLAMTLEDLKYSQQYFIKEGRNPYVTEIKVLDTYWSDHCRHTTFMTSLTEIDLEDNNIEALDQSFDHYLCTREALGREDKDINLMDLATIAVRDMKAKGHLDDLEVSEEINACSMVAPVEVDGEEVDYLIMFKNETHNHPTEIEPFGGAATCLGGAIRDPLSGRSYVYQSMRITGSGDPRTPIEETIQGKLPQRSITIGAAHGFSSYGNQIGLNTGYVREYYNEKYIAKRMEVGFVIAASEKKDVTRGIPAVGDLVLLLGGRTGRDGVGGATGSSKIHDEQSIEESGAEVQKGNPPVERKIQRLFRNAEISQMIKRSNDFGAGGVSVAIGEIADSVDVNLDKVSKKYDGLDGTELAISESQERMAVVIAETDLDTFIAGCEKENLEVAVVAKVTDDNRFRLRWRDQVILDLDREFLNSAGAPSYSKIKVGAVNLDQYPLNEEKTWEETLEDLNVASQKGLVQRFDNSIGRNNVLSYLGGKYLMTPIQGMVSTVPVEGNETSTVSFVSNGYNPTIASWSPFHGGMYAVIESISKQVALGGKVDKIRFTFQEYFERLGQEPLRWGKPFSAILGANSAMAHFNLASIGGKDSMSGTYTLKDQRIDVPPSLISFAVSMGNVEQVISPELKGIGHDLILFEAKKNADQTFNYNNLSAIYDEIQALNDDKKILSAYVVEYGGLKAAIAKMTFGNKIGVEIDAMPKGDLFASIVVEVVPGVTAVRGQKIGQSIEASEIRISDMNYGIDELISCWQEPLETVFPTERQISEEPQRFNFYSPTYSKAKTSIARPKVFIPVFPGTNCEYDTAYQFEQAGADVDVLIFRNNSSRAIEESIDEIARRIKESQIIALAGGFSAGDEPEGSGKFIASVFKNQKISESVMDLIDNRDGLMIGICNGFQALIKLGLVPYGDIRSLSESDPTLTFNDIGRHVAQIVNTKVVSNNSPWMRYADTDIIYKTPVSHGEGKFFANSVTVEQLADQGQIAIQYVDDNGNPTYKTKYNPNGSIHAIEAITSPDGRILGKMGHTERVGNRLAINVPDMGDLKLFQAGVEYFK